MECDSELGNLPIQFKSEEVGFTDNERILRPNLRSSHDALLWLKQYEEEHGVNFIVEDSMSSEPKRYIYIPFIYLYVEVSSGIIDCLTK